MYALTYSGSPPPLLKILSALGFQDTTLWVLFLSLLCSVLHFPEGSSQTSFLSSFLPWRSQPLSWL